MAEASTAPDSAASPERQDDGDGQRRGSRLGSAVPVAITVAVVLALVWILFESDLENEAKGGVAAGLMLVLLLMKVPVGAAMGIAGALGIWALTSQSALIGTLGDLPFGSTASFTLTVLPMFIFMGLMLWRSGITSDVYVTARHWTGWMPGGLAVTTNVAGAGLASVSGSTIGITYALSRIGIPEMLKAGYDRRLTVGAVMVAGTVGQLIPPSIYSVVYAGFAETAVGPQLLAGLVPGIMLAAGYVAVVLIFVTLRPALAPKGTGPQATWSDRWSGLAKVWPLPALIFLVVGGLYAGVFTATEAGAFGAMGAVILAAVKMPFSDFTRGLWEGLKETAAAVGAILFLLVGAAILNRMLALSGTATWFAETIDQANLGRAGLILLMVGLYILLGMFMEPLSMMLLTIPVLLPAAVAVGIDPIWFGVFLILLAEVGIITPPVGILVFVVHRLAQAKEVRGDLPMPIGTVFAGGLMFLPAAAVVIALIAIFPDIVTWLPNLGEAE